MDAIGEIHPKSTKGCSYILVAMDYFTRWIKAIPMRSVTQEGVIEFLKEHIIFCFGLPQSITVNQGTTFNESEIRAFADEFEFKLINSSLYYSSENGQAESSNKIIENNIRRMIDRNLREWADLLQSTLRAHRVDFKKETGTILYRGFAM